MSQLRSSDQSSDRLNEQDSSKRTSAEWITFGIASCILASIVGLVLYVWLGTAYEELPEIQVTESGDTRELGGSYYIPFEVSNTGGSTAESVQVIAELEIDGVVESAEQQIDFLSGGEIEEGAFVFSQNPQSGELTLRVGSYKLP